jgi:SNF2 family DNA or RNA helicase
MTHILDEEWNPGRRDQAYARTHRMGQTEDTEVFVYRVPGGVDAWMANMIRRKERMVEEFEDVQLEQQMREQILAG